MSQINTTLPHVAVHSIARGTLAVYVHLEARTEIADKSSMG